MTKRTVADARQDLMRVFRRANDLLRTEGLREGLERFTEFSTLLFLKLLSEIEAARERRGDARTLPRRYCWDQFCDVFPEAMLEELNGFVLPRLAARFNRAGPVVPERLAIRNPKTLKRIVDGLTALTLLEADSDVKGAAFEFFLQNSITVGNDLGEYYTPRHIVRLMVDLVDPAPGDKVYDPACGTGGFLVHAARHQRRRGGVSPPNPRAKTVYGRELTPTAAVARMNMLLLGHRGAEIRQMDSLSQPLKNRFDVVLTNFPFSQKTAFGARYGFDTENANPVFLMHVIGALRRSGRAAVVVPEGLLFEESAAGVAVRRELVDTCRLRAVIKLHNFVFRPYTGQPTSILVFDKDGLTEAVWFFEVGADGFKKTASRLGRPQIGADDLPELRRAWPERADTDRSFSVGADAIRARAYKLSMDLYRERPAREGWVPLGEVCDVKIGGTPATNMRPYWGGPHPWVTISDMKEMTVTDTERTLTDAGVAHSSVKLLAAGTVLYSFKLSVGKVAIAGTDLYTNEAIAGIVPKDDRALPRFLYYLLPRLDLAAYAQHATKGRTLNKSILESVLIPLPPRRVQETIVRAMERTGAAVGRRREEIRHLEEKANDAFWQRIERTRR